MSSVSFGSADDGMSNVPKDSVGGIVVDGDSLYVAGGRFENSISSEWVAKLDAHRVPVWSKVGTSTSNVQNIALAGHDSIVVAGFEIGAIATSTDIFVAKVDAATGSEIWRKAFVATKDNVSNVATAVAVKGGDIYITGLMMGTVAFGATSLASANGDFFVARLDLEGNVASAFKSGLTADGSIGSAIAVAPDGDVLIAGSVSAGTLTDGFVAKYSPDGTLRWGTTTKATNGQLYDVTTDAAGNVYVAGVADARGVVKKLDAGGHELWSKAWGKVGSGRDVSAVSVDVAADGSVLIGGGSSSPSGVDFGGGPIGGGFVPVAVVVELDADGNHRCSRAFPAKVPASPGGGAVTAGAGAGAVAYTSATSYVASGNFAGTLDLGKGPMTSAAGYDVFVGDFKR